MLPLLVQSRPGSDGNKGVFCIPQSSSIAGASPSDCLVSYLGHSLGGVLLLCREAVGVFYSPNRLGKRVEEVESRGRNNLHQVIWFPVFLIEMIDTQLYIKDSCKMQIICTQLYGFKYSYLIQIICTQLYSFKYSYQIQKKITQLYDIKYSYLIQIIYTQLYRFTYSYQIIKNKIDLFGLNTLGKGMNPIILPPAMGK